ncbi:hypothetical protein HPB50_021637 [Hyalomma asiaticum]|uniref:Uncharacterized protein n=1 Tax=Hyalomma asiaticum TaxID=266040 RepID=A0ACB7T3W8_HYAAI|nr:hypothetical protein HPB50_021637 [Hyalomma asiaticum]
MFWPDFNSTSKYGNVTVEHMESTGFPGLVVRSFKICQSNNSPRILKQFHCSSWNRLEKLPGSHECALDLIRRADQWQMRAEGAPVIVQCLDGCQECGLYCVLASVCEQLKLEHEVDVFRCVQRVRESRPEFIVRLVPEFCCVGSREAHFTRFDSVASAVGLPQRNMDVCPKGSEPTLKASDSQHSDIMVAKAKV